MHWNDQAIRAAIVAGGLAMTMPVLADTTAADELQDRVNALESELRALSAGQGAANAAELEAMREQLEAQQSQIEALAELAESGSGAASRVHFGGYGELHLNKLSADDSSNDVDEIDLHRFVLFTGYEFSDRIRFVSELEVEHSIAGEGQAGEVEVEQAYIEYDINANAAARGGLMLIPVGILNETHEPPTFYGVERNDVENIIVPSTWWAGGAAVTLRSEAGWQWDFMIHEGLAMPTTGGSAYRVRSGRQKTSEATATDFAYTTRLRYTGVQGVELAATLQYQSDPSQVDNDGLDDGLLYTVHANLNRGAFGLRALYGAWQFSGDAVEAAGADEQTGWYLEPSWRLMPALGVYARYEDLDAVRTQDQFNQWEVGANYYLHPQVVLKADFRMREHDLASEAGRDFDGVDLGIGYYF